MADTEEMPEKPQKKQEPVASTPAVAPEQSDKRPPSVSSQFDEYGKPIGIPKFGTKSWEEHPYRKIPRGVHGWPTLTPQQKHELLDRISELPTSIRTPLIKRSTQVGAAIRPNWARHPLSHSTVQKFSGGKYEGDNPIGYLSKYGPMPWEDKILPPAQQKAMDFGTEVSKAANKYEMNPENYDVNKILNPDLKHHMQNWDRFARYNLDNTYRRASEYLLHNSDENVIGYADVIAKYKDNLVEEKGSKWVKKPWAGQVHIIDIKTTGKSVGDIREDAKNQFTMYHFLSKYSKDPYIQKNPPTGYTIILTKTGETHQFTIDELMENLRTNIRPRIHELQDVLRPNDMRVFGKYVNQKPHGKNYIRSEHKQEIDQFLEEQDSKK